MSADRSGEVDAPRYVSYRERLLLDASGNPAVFEVEIPATRDDAFDLVRTLARLRVEDRAAWKVAYRRATATCWYTLGLLLSQGQRINAFTGQVEMDHDFLWRRFRELQFHGDRKLDKSFRGSWKSHVRGLVGVINRLALDPNLVVAFIAHERQAAFKHAARTAAEIADNADLRLAWDDAFYMDPLRESPLWNQDKGWTVRQTIRSVLPSISYYAIMEAPTGGRVGLFLPDDVEDEKTVDTEDQREKLLSRFISFLDTAGRQPEIWPNGTSFHPNGLVAHLERSGAFDVICHPAEDISQPAPDVAALYDACEGKTPDGKELPKKVRSIRLDGAPVYLHALELADKRLLASIKPGGLANYCLPPTAPILMTDFTERPIGELVPGDSVIGFKRGNGSSSERDGLMKLASSEVTWIHQREAELFRYSLSNGRFIECTASHMWWNPRHAAKRREYAPLESLQHNDLKTLAFVLPEDRERDALSPEEKRAADWLGGFYDGEGACTPGTCLALYQSLANNPEVINRARQCLRTLGFEWSEYVSPKDLVMFQLRGGWRAYIRFKRLCDPSRARGILNTAYKSSRIGGRTDSVKVIGRELVGVREVVSMETTTGNYVAYGIASKNCRQMMGDTMAGMTHKLDPAHIRRYEGTPEDRAEGATFAMTIDGSRGINDPTVALVWALHADETASLVAGLRRKIETSQFGKMIFNLWSDWEGFGDFAQIRIEMFGQAAYDFMVRSYFEGRHRDCPRLIPIVSSQRNNKESGRKREYDQIEPMLRLGKLWFPGSPVKDGSGKITGWTGGILVEDDDGATFDLCDYAVTEEILPFPTLGRDDFVASLALLGVRPDAKVEGGKSLVGPLPYPDPEFVTLMKKRSQGLLTRRRVPRGGNWSDAWFNEQEEGRGGGWAS